MIEFLKNRNEHYSMGNSAFIPFGIICNKIIFWNTVEYQIYFAFVHFRSPSTFAAHNIMNGPQPANFQAPQSAQAIKQESPFTAPTQTPIQPQIQSTPAAQIATPKETAQQVAVKEENLLANAQSTFEKSLVNFAQTKGQLIQNLEVLSIARSFLDEKSTNFDVGE
jgi:hypothetical protein